MQVIPTIESIPAVPLDVGRRLADDAAGAVHPAAVVGGPLQVRAGVARLLGLFSWRIFTHLSAVLGNLIFLNKINGLYVFVSAIQEAILNLSASS